MRRKKLLRQIAAAAVALSMAVSLSAPAFAAEFDLANGRLVITANDDGITVKQDGLDEATSIKDDEEIVVKGTYKPAGEATLTAEENRQEEKDRRRAENDYKVNLKTEIMIEDLHNKVNSILAKQEYILKQLEKSSAEKEEGEKK